MRFGYRKIQVHHADITTREVILTEERIQHIKERQEIVECGECFQLALRLVTPADNPAYKNSIITFMKIRKKE